VLYAFYTDAKRGICIWPPSSGPPFWVVFQTVSSPIFVENTAVEPEPGLSMLLGRNPAGPPGPLGDGIKGANLGENGSQKEGCISGPAGRWAAGAGWRAGPGRGLSDGTRGFQRGERAREGGPTNWVWGPFLFRPPWLVGPRGPRQTPRRHFSGPGGGDHPPTSPRPPPPPCPILWNARTQMGRLAGCGGVCGFDSHRLFFVCLPVPTWRPATQPDAYGHTTGNTPEPVRFQKLSLVRPS
jgi:hypothetical protein